MTYIAPDKVIPLLINDCSEMFEHLKNDKIKLSDLENSFIDLFSNTKHDSKHVVNCIKMLYQASLSASLEVNRIDFDVREQQKFLKQEYNYKEAAKILGIKYSTIKKYIAENKLEVKTYNERVKRITQNAIEQYQNQYGKQNLKASI